MIGAIPNCVDPGWTEAAEVGDIQGVGRTARILFYGDGTVRFEHLCDRGHRGVIICSPALQTGPHGDGHKVTSRDPVTVTPSILCPDCGSHGFVTEGRWVTA